MMRAAPNSGFSQSGVLGGEKRQFHGHEVGRVAFAMDGMGPKGTSSTVDITTFGGEPFVMH